MNRFFRGAVSALVAMGISTSAHATCVISIKTEDPAQSGFAATAASSAAQNLKLNGCKKGNPGDDFDYSILVRIDKLETKKRANPTGMLLAGGLSSAIELRSRATVTLIATSGGGEKFETTISEAPAPYELFSGYRRAKGVKKRAVQEAVALAVSDFARKQLAIAEPKKAFPGTSDFVNKDRDIWPILGAGLTDIAIHESGHFANAALTGHRAHFQGNDSKTFNAGPEMTGGMSVMFAHHTNENQLLPLLPDVLYDFGPVRNSSGGIRYVDDNGSVILHHGRRDHALIAYSGILFQNMTNEYILTKHPNLKEEDNPYMKGMFFFNVFIPSFYTVWGSSDANSDLKLLGQSLEYDKWQVNTMVLVPSAIDVYRYYHPEKKMLKKYARVAKLIPLAIVLSQ